MYVIWTYDRIHRHDHHIPWWLIVPNRWEIPSEPWGMCGTPQNYYPSNGSIEPKSHVRTSYEPMPHMSDTL